MDQHGADKHLRRVMDCEIVSVYAGGVDGDRRSC